MTCNNKSTEARCAVSAPAAGSARPGIFITFEGGEGSGKSTHSVLLAQLIEEAGRKVLCLRDPGGTRIGEQLRGVVLDAKNAEMSDMCELFIYEAARAQLVSEVIRPALDSGVVVVCDRFSDSTVAYQAYGRGIDADLVQQANKFACQGVTIDRTIIMSAPNADDGLKRAIASSGVPDRLEGASSTFHEKVRTAFECMAHSDPQRIRSVISRGTVEDTFAQVVDAVSDLLPEVAELFARRREHAGKDAC